MKPSLVSSRCVARVAVLVVLAGCSDEPPPCVLSSSAPATGLLAGPADMPQTDCAAGGLAGRDPRGMWFVAVDHPFPLYFGHAPTTITGECDQPATVTVRGTEMPTIALSDSAWFWRAEFVFGRGNSRGTEAYLVCADEGGELIGHHSYCFTQGGEEPECETQTLTMRSYGPIPDEPPAAGLELLASYRGDGDGWEDGFVANVRVRDGIAYVAHQEEGLLIVDVSDPAAPAQLGRYADAGGFNDVKIADGPDDRRYALMASASAGIVTLDVTDPAAPTLASIFEPTAQDFGAHTLYLDTFAGVPAAFAVDGATPILGIYDITDPSAPVSIGGYSGGDEALAYHDLYVEDGIAYVNATGDGFLIIDAAAEEPVLAQFDSGDYSHSNWVTTADGRRISVHGGEGYDAHVQIVDLDAHSPTYMQRIGEWRTRPEVSVHNIVAIGERAYLAHYQDGVRVLDLSDPTEPVEIAHFNTYDFEAGSGALLDGTGGIDVHEDEGLLYATDSQLGLVILRIVP